MLEERKRSAMDRRSVPVVSRSGLTYYLQGECFRALAAEGWNRDAAAEKVAGSAQMASRVRAKLDHFLEGALEALRAGGVTHEQRLSALKCRFAKMPECYETDLKRLAEEFERGRWAR